MKPRPIPSLLCLGHVLALACGAADRDAGRAEITDVGSLRTRIVQGEPVPVSYRVTGGGQNLSVTTFVRQGTLEAAPKAWHKGAIRFEPMYQISHRDMKGKTKRVRCALPGRLTRHMKPGPYTLFVAISNPPAGWEIVKLGEFVVDAYTHIDVPRRAGRPQVAVWRDNVRIEGASSSPERLAALVEEAGAAPTFLTSAALGDKATFSRDRFDLLVLPYGGALPASAQENIAAFLRRAGAIISVGGPPLAAQSEIAAGAEPRPPVKVANMEPDAALRQLGIEHGPQTAGRMERVAPGAAGTSHALEVHVPALKDWYYAAIPLAHTGADGHTIRFWAKGDARTDKLCLELNESDGSRWKYFVRLTPKWQQYSVRMTDFAAYASPKRAGVGDRFRPEREERLKLGFYRALFDDDQPRTFWLDEVERCSTATASGASASAHWAEWAKQYAYLKARPPVHGLGLVRDLRRVTHVRRIAAAPGQRFVPGDIQLEGRFSGWEVTPVTALAATDHWSQGTTVCARHIPLLEASDADGRPLGVVASLLFNFRGPYRGSSCALFCVDNEDLFAADKPAMAQAFVRTVRGLAAPAYLFDIEPEFRSEAGRLVTAWRVCVANLSGKARTLSLRVAPLRGGSARAEPVTLDAGEVRQVPTAIDAGGLDLKRFGVRVVLESEGEAVDEMAAQADALASLTAAGDWLVANQKPQGFFSNYYYADVYGARAMRVLTRLTGRPSYAAAGLRMTDMLVRDQRPGGGWWVGYGPPGECVFVADDGCLALALVQLAPYVAADKRRVYLDAARKFVQFREGFRITDQVALELETQYGKGHKGILPGGLGIGYVRTDYFANKPYPRPHREMRQYPWTLHCSLAFLGGLWSVAHDDGLRRVAVQDTKWFLDRVAEGTDSVTSPYANEAAVWMLDTLEDVELRARLKRALQEKFLPHVAAPNQSWWTRSGGRGALLLPGLVYCSRDLDPSAATQAALARALWALCGDASSVSLQSIAKRYGQTSNGEVVMYVCFSGLGLAELLEPRSTLMPR